VDVGHPGALSSMIARMKRKKTSFRRLWSEGEEEQQGEMHEKRCLHSGTVTKL